MAKEMKSVLEIDTNKPSVFISYSWDGEEHKKKVERLVIELEKAGIQAVWDQKDFRLGDPLQYMMTQAIEKCDYVLLVCTPRYKEKTDLMFGGAGFEESIISGDVFNNQNQRKYIPIIANGTIETAMPIWAKGKLGVFMTDDKEFESGIQKLIKTILPEQVQKEEPKGFYAVSEELQCAILESVEIVFNKVSLVDYHSCLEDMAILLDDIDMDGLSEKVKELLEKKKRIIEDLIIEDINDLENDR